MGGGNVEEGAAAAVYTGVVYPVMDGSEVFFGEGAEGGDVGCRGNVAFRAVDFGGGVLCLEGGDGGGGVGDVAYHDGVAAGEELVGVRVADAVGAAGDYHAEVELGSCSGERRT